MPAALLDYPLRVFVGYDSHEDDAWLVCRRSLIEQSSVPLLVTPLRQRLLRRLGLYRRGAELDDQRHLIDQEDRRPFSTEFAFSRFLVPHLMMWEGWALFCDCDFLWRADVNKLLSLADDSYAVMVVQHDYTPGESVKMDGQVQSTYARKNWSSLVLWNCGAHEHWSDLTTDAINCESGSWLHGFRWIPDERIGSISVEWNWLEGVSDPAITPSAVHFTRGGPWHPGYESVAYADEWRAALDRERAAVPAGYS